MMNVNWDSIIIGLGIASIVIGLARIFLWNIDFMDSIELFIIGLGLIAIAFSNRKRLNKNK